VNIKTQIYCLLNNGKKNHLSARQRAISQSSHLVVKYIYHIKLNYVHIEQESN